MTLHLRHVEQNTHCHVEEKKFLRVYRLAQQYSVRFEITQVTLESSLEGFHQKLNVLNERFVFEAYNTFMILLKIYLKHLVKSFLGFFLEGYY